jgi:hypothetical protein
MKITKNTDNSYNFIMDDNRLYKVDISVNNNSSRYNATYCGVINPSSYKQGKKLVRTTSVMKQIFKSLNDKDYSGKKIYQVGLIK